MRGAGPIGPDAVIPRFAAVAAHAALVVTLIPFLHPARPAQAAHIPQRSSAPRAAFTGADGTIYVDAALAPTPVADGPGAGHDTPGPLAIAARMHARRAIVVDATSARLWMIEDGRIAGTMPVIVGKRAMPTPRMAAFIRFLVLDPYWNVPPDLVRDAIAPRVLAGDRTLLARKHFELLSGWGTDARPLAPQQVDWDAVAQGRADLRVRQAPGPRNMMGQVKFMFPNERGIYLHDTPDKWAFARPDRRMSSGCVRVADAPRLAAWLMRGRTLPWSGKVPEHRIDLPEPVPVMITYFADSPASADPTI